MIRAVQRPLAAAAQAAQSLARTQTLPAAGTAANAAAEAANMAGQPAALARRPKAGAASPSLAQRGPGPASLASRTSGAGPTLPFAASALQQRGAHQLTTGAEQVTQDVREQVALMNRAFQQQDRKMLDNAGKELSTLGDKAASHPEARVAHREALAVAISLGNGAPDVLEAVFDGINTVQGLADRLDVDDGWAELPDQLKGRCELKPDECMALSMYSVREKHAPGAPQVFRAVNAVMRSEMPAAQECLKFVSDPLVAGMKKLPALPNTELRRGLLITPHDKSTLADLAAQYQVGKEVRLPSISTGSREAAYPGNVVFLMRSAAEDTRLRDTSAFSYVPEQKEASFLPGTTFKVKSCQEQQVPKEWARADHLVESSGRKWGDRVGQPVLVVVLQEQPSPMT
jgi:hypothetical protein